MVYGNFEWDPEKERKNIRKHRLSFKEAAEVFLDHHRVVRVDTAHSLEELRLYCVGKVRGELVTVRFTFRKGNIRIFGAGFWRDGQSRYDNSKRP